MGKKNPATKKKYSTIWRFQLNLTNSQWTARILLYIFQSTQAKFHVCDVCCSIVRLGQSHGIFRFNKTNWSKIFDSLAEEGEKKWNCPHPETELSRSIFLIVCSVFCCCLNLLIVCCGRIQIRIYSMLAKYAKWWIRNSIQALERNMNRYFFGGFSYETTFLVDFYIQRN